MTEIEVTADDVDALYAFGTVDLEAARELPCHNGLVLLSGRGSALGRVTPDKQVRLVRGDREAFGLRGRWAEQRVALDLLLDPEIGIVSLGGRAGTGKSALALCAGLEAVLERRQHKKVVVFRPLFAVGGQELGDLPGSESEKMQPWAQAGLRHPRRGDEQRRHRRSAGPRHAGGAAADPHPGPVSARRLRRRRRGPVPRAQRLAHGALPGRGELTGDLTTHDVAQRDNLQGGCHDGVVAVVEKL